MKKIYSFVIALFFILTISSVFNLSFAQIIKGDGGDIRFPIILPSLDNYDFKVDPSTGWTGFDMLDDYHGSSKIYLGINSARPLSDVLSIMSVDGGGNYIQKLSLNSDGGALFTGMVNLQNSPGETSSLIKFLWNTGLGQTTAFTITHPSENKLFFNKVNSNGESTSFMTFNNVAGNVVNIGIGTANPQASLDVGGDMLLSGSMTLGGNTTVGGNISVTGTTTLTRDLIANSPASFNSGINVTGNTGLQNLQVTGNTALGEYVKLSSNLSSAYTLKVKTLGDDNWGIEHSAMNTDNDWYGMGLRIMDNGSNGFYIRDKTTNQKRLVIKDGKVGIGKSNPQYVLDVNGSINATDLRINGNSLMDKLWVPINGGLSFTGSIGIGTTTPKGRMHVVGDIVVGNDANNQKFIMHTRTENSGDFLQIAPDNAQGNWNWSEGLTLTRSGNVGIGVTNPTQKLSVEGTILSKEVLVSTSAANWPDYVFEENYNLKPLKELESFVNTEKHLPGIPTADEVEAKGIEVGDMVSKLLKKVEELTLYVIEQDKQIQQIKEENDNLKSLIQK